MPPKTRADSPIPATDDAIRERAYYLWEANGKPSGRDEHYWHLAKSQLSAPEEAAPKPKPKAKLAKTVVTEPAAPAKAKSKVKSASSSRAKAPE